SSGERNRDECVHDDDGPWDLLGLPFSILRAGNGSVEIYSRPRSGGPYPQTLPNVRTSRRAYSKETSFCWTSGPRGALPARRKFQDSSDSTTRTSRAVSSFSAFLWMIQFPT